MKGKMILRTGMMIVMVAVLLGWGIPASGQDNMQILRDKIKADKKLLVATNMELTDSEAKGVLARLRGVPERPEGDQPAHCQTHRELCRGLSGEIAHRRKGQEAR